MMSLALTAKLRSDASLPTRELVYAIHTFDGAPSGGKAASVLDLFDKYSLTTIRAGLKPTAMCPINPPKASKSFMTRLLGIRSVPYLGMTTTSLNGLPDVPIVTRSWGLLGGIEPFGARFTFTPRMLVKNPFLGIMIHFVAVVLPFILGLPPIRWLLRRLIPESGHGPSEETGAYESRALAFLDASSN